MPYKIYRILICCGLVGCTVGPDYKKPESITLEQWQAEKNTEGGLKPVDPESLKTWWKSFNDPHLNRLIDLAISGNLDLKISLTRIDQARAERRGTRHTYATLMLMSGANPAWAASQLGHSMQMFLTVYARWIREADKGRELSKLETILKETNKTTIDKNTPESQQNNSKCAKNKKPLVKWLY